NVQDCGRYISFSPGPGETHYQVVFTGHGVLGELGRQFRTVSIDTNTETYDDTCTRESHSGRWHLVCPVEGGSYSLTTLFGTGGKKGFSVMYGDSDFYGGFKRDYGSNVWVYEDGLQWPQDPANFNFSSYERIVSEIVTPDGRKTKTERRDFDVDFSNDILFRLYRDGISSVSHYTQDHASVLDATVIHCGHPFDYTDLHGVVYSANARSDYTNCSGGLDSCTLTQQDIRSEQQCFNAANIRDADDARSQAMKKDKVYFEQFIPLFTRHFGLEVNHGNCVAP
ncbi:hypothetical protein U5801_27110, partial [Lamprobacter modestohalophilus]|uniref:hypothetical protein n=1 Tax=Lamprobacter modestohalophilus TaxID=1064514 RepID=UPI002ADEB537